MMHADVERGLAPTGGERVRGTLASIVVAAVLGSSVGAALPPRATAQSQALNAAVPAAGGVEVSVRNEALHSIQLGLDWLREHQSQDGSWGRGYPAITALGATALLRSPLSPPAFDGSAADRALKYILSQQRADGGIYPESPPQMQSYNTSICLMALVAADDPAYAEAIRRARQFLIGLQSDESNGYGPDSIYYGGIGYGGDGRPDLSNLQWSLEALKVSQDYAPRGEATVAPVDEATPTGTARIASVSGQGLFWDKAIVFLQRCQNLPGTSGQDSAGTDGGFVYNPSESKAGGHTSYGSMTYAGMKSLVYAGLRKDDSRVRAAFEWCSRNYNMDVNPEMGQQGLYYYYHTIAKSLNAYGTDVIVDPKGVRHRWREDLIVKLASLQKPDGSWQNAVARWWENNPDLVTPYCVMALEEALSTGLTTAFPTGTPKPAR